MLDRCLHVALHLRAQRWKDLAVPGRERPLAFGPTKFVKALLHDAHRLAHFLHPYEIAVVAVAVLADRDINIELRITFVRLRLAQIPGRPGATHHDAREAPTPRVGELDFSDSDIALLEDAILREQDLKVVADLQEWVAKRPDVIEKLGRQILMDAADPEIVGVHACA